MSIINTAFASTGAATQANQFSFMSFLPMVIIFVLFWFLLIRPQQKKAKTHNAMLSSLQKGDEITTTGGLVATIVAVSDNLISAEIAPNVTVTLQRSAVSGKATKQKND